VCRAPDGYLAVAETATHAVANFGGTANDCARYIYAVAG
jgi:hypothetical protein